MKKFLYIVLSAAAACLLLGGCQVEEASVQNGGSLEYYLYRLNAGETELIRDSYTPESEATQDMLDEFMGLLTSPETENGETGILPQDVSVNHYELGEDGVLSVDFNAGYQGMSSTRELLTRAGIVKTFVQIPGIRAVVFYINGAPLENSGGEVLGEMNNETFVSYPGEDMDAYRSETFILYFTDRTGEHLVPEERRLYYRRNIPREQVILEQLSAGPMNAGNYPTVPENMGINDITISDRVCYIDLDRSFLEYAMDASLPGEIPVYSIVNSILDACEADRVQITINGSSEEELINGVELYRFFEKNEDLVTEAVQQES